MVEINVSAKRPIEVDVSNKFINIFSITPDDIITILGYTPEDEANKVAAFQPTPTDVAYPSEKLVKDTFVALEQAIEDRWNNFVTITNVQPEDMLIHNGSTFINRPKKEITDGGNF